MGRAMWVIGGCALAVVAGFGISSWKDHQAAVRRRVVATAVLSDAKRAYTLGWTERQVVRQLGASLVTQFAGSAGFRHEPGKDEFLILVHREPAREWFCRNDDLYVDLTFERPVNALETGPFDMDEQARLEMISVLERPDICL